MAVLLQHNLYKSLQSHENMGQKLIISSDFGYFSNILTPPSIICVDKRSGGCKLSSRYFSKMLSIPRYRAYGLIASVSIIYMLQYTVSVQGQYISVHRLISHSLIDIIEL